MPIAKLCVNIAFSGAVRILAASPYTKSLNTDSASYSSLVAAVSLNTRSICKLRVISAMAPHSSLALQINEGWNLDNKINAQAAIILVCMEIPPQSLIYARYSR